MSKTIYLDNAAATPVAQPVLKAMEPYWSAKFYNPSALYMPSREVKKDIESARAAIAHWLGAKPGEIIFTSGGTEANNLAIHGIMSRYPNGNIITSAVEHESVLEPARRYNCKEAAVKPSGLLDLGQLENLIDEETVLVSIIYANNEVGTIQPLRKVANILKKKRAERAAKRSRTSPLPLFFHSDGAQAANYLDLHASGLGVDLLSINGGKMYGPKASGALFAKAGVNLAPTIYGGKQERGLRSGTENVPGIIGLAKALELAQTQRAKESERLQGLQKHFLNTLRDKIPEAIINGSLDWRLPNNTHITIPGQDNERLIMQLESQGILCAAGSACSAGKDEPSHVLKSMGVSDQAARSSLRFTLGRSTTKTDINKTIKALDKICHE